MEFFAGVFIGAVLTIVMLAVMKLTNEVSVEFHDDQEILSDSDIKWGDQVIIEIPAIVQACITELNSGARYRVMVDGETFWVNASEIKKKAKVEKKVDDAVNRKH